jgi:hypothetical protein
MNILRTIFRDDCNSFLRVSPRILCVPPRNKCVSNAEIHGVYAELRGDRFDNFICLLK